MKIRQALWAMRHRFPVNDDLLDLKGADGFSDGHELPRPIPGRLSVGRKRKECRDEAARALNEADRQSWLKMAEEWMTLARSSEEIASLEQSARRRDDHDPN
jgi:hypothetical protein